MALCVEQTKSETLYTKKSLYYYHMELSSINIQSSFWHLKSFCIYIMDAVGVCCYCNTFLLSHKLYTIMMTDSEQLPPACPQDETLPLKRIIRGSCQSCSDTAHTHTHTNTHIYSSSNWRHTYNCSFIKWILNTTD